MGLAVWPLLAVHAGIMGALIAALVNLLIQRRCGPQSLRGRLAMTIAVAAFLTLPMVAANLLALPVAGVLSTWTGWALLPIWCVVAAVVLYGLCAGVASATRPIGGGPLQTKGKLITAALCVADAASIGALALYGQG